MLLIQSKEDITETFTDKKKNKTKWLTQLPLQMISQI